MSILSFEKRCWQKREEDVIEKGTRRKEKGEKRKRKEKEKEGERERRKSKRRERREKAGIREKESPQDDYCYHELRNRFS